MPKALTRERQQFLFDVFVTAMEGGIGCWSVCDKYHWRKPGSDPQGRMDDISDLAGFYAEIDDTVTGKSHRIDSGVILKGLKAIPRMTDNPATGSSSGGLHKSNRRVVLWASHDNDAGEIDAPLADYIVQCGLFGEVIYG